MIVIGLAALGAVVGVSLLGSFGMGLWVGGAIGALAGWALVLERRIQSLETLARERAALEMREESLRAGAEPAERAAPPSVSLYERPVPVAGEPAPRAGAALRREPVPPVESAPLSEPPSPVELVSPLERAAAQAARETSPSAAHAPAFAPPPHPLGTRHAGPDLLERAVAAVKRWCTTGNVPVKAGVVLSIIGVGFLVKEAVDRGWLFVPLPLRLVGVALFGLVLLAIGWRLRRREPVYALSVQGGGIAVLYLTTYAAFALYGLIPAPLAFLLLVAVTAAAGTLAVLQNAYALAVLGIVGGFVAPVLTSDGSGNHVVLFGYYAILNAGVLGIAWFRAWRALNVLGFFFTFVIGALWGYMGYRPEQLASTEPFLVLFVLMYTAIPILFASRDEPRIRGFVDGTLVFGTPIVGFALQAQLVAGTEHGLALSAAAWAALYGCLAYALVRRGGERLRVLAEAFFGLGIAFATLTVPLAFDARWTSAAWSLEGAAVVWLGWRQRRALALAMGAVLQVLAAVAFMRQPFVLGDAPAFLNGYYVGAVVIAIASFVSAWMLDRAREHVGHAAVAAGAWLFVAWGAAWWIVAGLLEIDRVLPEPTILSGMLAFLAITVWLGLLAAEQFAWPRILGLGAVLAPAMAVIAFSATSLHGHPLASYGWLAWPLAFAVHVAFLARARGRLGVGGGLLVPFGYWILAGIAAVEAGWWTSRVAAGVWPSVAALGAVAVLVLVTLRLAALPGALGRQASCYVIGGAGGAALAAFVAMLILNFGSAGNAPPLPYVPLLNPLEIVSVVLVLTVARWHAVGGRDAAVMPARITLAPPVLVALYLLTMVVARTVHHWGAVPFDFDRLLESDTFQAALSIVWGTAGLAGMIVGAKRAVRSVWIAGAALMAIVVVKLFLVELDNSGTVERVVSFLGVGVLLLVVGYFAPVPPRARDASGAGDAVGAGDAASAARPGPAEA